MRSGLLVEDGVPASQEKGPLEHLQLRALLLWWPGLRQLSLSSGLLFQGPVPKLNHMGILPDADDQIEETRLLHSWFGAPCGSETVLSRILTISQLFSASLKPRIQSFGCSRLAPDWHATKRDFLLSFKFQHVQLALQRPHSASQSCMRVDGRRTVLCIGEGLLNACPVNMHVWCTKRSLLLDKRLSKVRLCREVLIHHSWPTYIVWTTLCTIESILGQPSSPKEQSKPLGFPGSVRSRANTKDPSHQAHRSTRVWSSGKVYQCRFELDATTAILQA